MLVARYGRTPNVHGDECVVLTNAVIRSVGGAHRPGFPVRIERRTLVAPACVLTGCEVGSKCYVATGVLGRVFEQSADDQDALHDRVMSHLLNEVLEYAERPDDE